MLCAECHFKNKFLVDTSSQTAIENEHYEQILAHLIYCDVIYLLIMQVV